jgi:hypothetical protein
MRKLITSKIAFALLSSAAVVVMLAPPKMSPVAAQEQERKKGEVSQDQYKVKAEEVEPDVVNVEGTAEARALFVEHSWAVVRANGTLSRGRNVTRVNRLGNGVYEVIFNRNVRFGMYQGTLADDADGIAPAGEIGLASRAGNVRGVFVVTFNSNGAIADKPFHLLVLDH